MGQALALASLGEGSTGPNPRVGCVLIRNGRAVGRGYHRTPGSPHAEAIAVEEAGELSRGATLYVNLEPCAHHGRTPPCADLLIGAGVTRVIAAIQDPNPLVNGAGFARLREAGVEVRIGPLAEEARDLNAAFLHWHATGKPLVTLKAALSQDGMLAARDGAARWISSAPARRFARRLRLTHDAVLIGSGTARADNPRLTARLPTEGSTSRRIVLSGRTELDPTLRLFTDSHPGGVTVFVPPGGPVSDRVAQVAEVVHVGGDPDSGRVDLRAVLQHLGHESVQSVLVEGGGRVHAALLGAGLVDRAALFVSGKLLGARGGVPLIDGTSVRDPERAPRVRPRHILPVGPDLLIVGAVRPAGPESEPSCSPD
jgi:diaminohydroxyphosphoribosylaminopyrimidine deaminase/5-amino-6-(5-phosphoribosylamino)uracil reductase